MRRFLLLLCVLVLVTACGGTAAVTDEPTPTVEPSPPPVEVVVWAVGDLCDDGTFADCDRVGALIAADAPAALLALGDLQYESGRLVDFQRYYDPKMGAGPGLKPITRPAPGNHEYYTGGASGYYDYWGAQAGERGKGYYAFDLGTWRVIATNSNCSKVGGCGPTSPQGAWLRAELEAAMTRCTVVFGHHPAFSDGNYSPGTSDGRRLFNIAQPAGADLFLSGHDHSYQRFAPRRADGVIDYATGLRQFVSGLGGITRYGLRSARAEYRYNAIDGALRLTLGEAGYTWQFVTIDGVVRDEGSGSCH